MKLFSRTPLTAFPAVHPPDLRGQQADVVHSRDRSRPAAVAGPTRAVRGAAVAMFRVIASGNFNVGRRESALVRLPLIRKEAYDGCQPRPPGAALHDPDAHRRG